MMKISSKLFEYISDVNNFKFKLNPFEYSFVVNKPFELS